ncbi:MAG TPA: HTTM domain-containing protein, partial [Gemmataceae bacterium]|nr:HTTM domain-containing protein [Gemmataceae bacterium]
MSEPAAVGLRPWLPWPLCDSPWWTEPVRAERLAALRIGVAIMLFVDIFTLYLPHADAFFGRDSLGSPEVFSASATSLRWSVLRWVESPVAVTGVFVAWSVAALFLLIGVLSRWSALIAWMLSISIIGINGYLHNSGDNVRTILLFYLMVCPCAAVWSLCNRRAHDPQKDSAPVLVHAWPLRLLFVQLAIIYFFNGVYKSLGSHWRDGDVLHYVLCNLAWTRYSYAQLPLPMSLIQFLSWSTLIWELGFPLLVMIPWTRKWTLWTGIGFHVGTAVSLQLCAFPMYMICLYLPLVPWEKYVDCWRQNRGPTAAE